MSEGFSMQGRCGRYLEGKTWRNGGSLKCSILGVNVVSYPKPEAVRLCQIANEICDGCLIRGPWKNNQDDVQKLATTQEEKQ